MIDFKSLLQFLTKKKIEVSVEEFFFLSIVRLQNEENSYLDSEYLSLIKLYYTNNVFYGRDLYNPEEAKIQDWNLMIDKLVKQGYLVDYRKDKKNFNLKELQVTEEFRNFIWTDDREKWWDIFYDVVVDACGGETNFEINGFPIPYFSLSSGDKRDAIKSHEDFKQYFWINICKGGDIYETEKFFVHTDFYIRNMKGGYLGTKVINFLLDYHEGFLKKDIEKEMRKNGM